MKKREIDAFGVLIGIIIGALFGYFIGMRMNPEKTQETIKDIPEGSVYLLQIMQSSNLSDLNNTLDGVGFSYEIIEDKGTYYVYTAIATNDAILTSKKADFIAYGFSPIIKSAYILDWPNKYSGDSAKFEFYTMAIDLLMKNLKGQAIAIPDKYLADPVDLEVFGNLALLRDIKNEKIKLSLQLETYHLLFEKLS